MQILCDFGKSFGISVTEIVTSCPVDVDIHQTGDHIKPLGIKYRIVFCGFCDAVCRCINNQLFFPKGARLLPDQSVFYDHGVLLFLDQSFFDDAG